MRHQSKVDRGHLSPREVNVLEKCVPVAELNRGAVHIPVTDAAGAVRGACLLAGEDLDPPAQRCIGARSSTPRAMLPGSSDGHLVLYCMSSWNSCSQLNSLFG